jgi:hypothetical protein
MWRKILPVLIAVCAWQGAALGQAVPDHHPSKPKSGLPGTPDQAKELPKLFDRLTQLTGEHPTQEDVYSKADELLWDVFPQGDSLKLELVDYVKHGDEGPRLCFAGLALIPFHDAATVRPILERAMGDPTSPAMRTCLRTAAGHVLRGVGVMCRGKGEVETPEDGTNDLNALIGCAEAAAQSSIGHYYAQEVNKVMLWPDKGGEYWEGLTYLAVGLAGILDLKDEHLLQPGLTSPDRFVFQTTMASLGVAVNRDFLGDLVNIKDAIYQTTPKERAAGKAADAWWKKYLREHPDGDWRPAVVAGFRDAGYKIEKDYSSSRSRQELLRALDDKEPRIRYNAYRLLNEIYKTHFDLDLAFFSGSYDFAAVEIPRGNHKADNEARLKKYWQKRFGQSDSCSSTAARHTTWQGALAQSKEISRIFDHLTQLTGDRLNEEDFYPKAKEVLWDVYPHDDSLKPELVDFVKHGADGPQLCFAGLALISFGDPATVRPMLERALDHCTSPATRTCFRKAATNLLNMPPAEFYGEKRKFDKDSNEFLEVLMEDADSAAKSGLGHLHAQRLHEAILDSPEDITELRNWHFRIILHHRTADMDGILDLKDEHLLGPALTSTDGWVVESMLAMLGYAVNRDFLHDLVAPKDKVTPEMERASKAADAWWQNYVREHPDGDWRPAVIAGFQEAGYEIEKDYGSARSQQELLRALDDRKYRVRYSAYRLLNEIYKTHFDLEIAFSRDIHNFGYPEHPAWTNTADNEARLKKYWQKRLGGGSVE